MLFKNVIKWQGLRDTKYLHYRMVDGAQEVQVHKALTKSMDGHKVALMEKVAVVPMMST